MPVRVGGDGEAIRDADAERRDGADHLAERRVFAADESDIGQTDFRKPADEAHACPSLEPACMHRRAAAQRAGRDAFYRTDRSPGRSLQVFR